MALNSIRGFDASAFKKFRILFALCILADAVWYIASFEVRAAYFKQSGLPVNMIYLVAVVYAFFGIRILFNYSLELTCLGMIGIFSVLTFLIHHDVRHGGIGAYPRHIHGEMNFLQALHYMGLIGGLLVLFGSVDMKERGKIMHGSKSYAIVLGRAITAIQFIMHTFYFKIFQYKLRTKQITLMDGSPTFHIFVVGAAHIMASYYAWLSDIPKQRRIASLVLTFITAAVAVTENSSLATSLGVYHMQLEGRIHHFIIQIGICTTCLLLYATAGMTSKPYVKEE
ncbi:uncharacterized protein LOC113474972 [Ciona intestinalis]